MGPAPVVDGRRVIDLDAVGGREHPPARTRDTPELPNGLSGVVAVLEHLRAEHDVERGVVDRQCLDRAEQLRSRVLDDIDPDVLRRDAREVRVVGLDAAADIEDAHFRACLELRSLRLQPGGQRTSDDPRR